MTLYGKKVSSYWELNEYKKGSKKIIITPECPVSATDGIVLFNRENKVACVLRVEKVQRPEGRKGLFYVSTILLNPEDQDISVEYFGYTGVVGLRFIGFTSTCKELRLTPKE